MIVGNVVIRIVVIGILISIHINVVNRVIIIIVMIRGRIKRSTVVGRFEDFVLAVLEIGCFGFDFVVSSQRSYCCELESCGRYDLPPVVHLILCVE